MEALNSTRLVTGHTYSAQRNGANHWNDLIFTKGLDVELVEEVVRGVDTQSDHNGIIFRLRNTSIRKGQLKINVKLLEDEERLSQWKAAVRELNDHSDLGH